MCYHKPSTETKKKINFCDQKAHNYINKKVIAETYFLGQRMPCIVLGERMFLMLLLT